MKTEDRIHSVGFPCGLRYEIAWSVESSLDARSKGPPLPRISGGREQARTTFYENHEQLKAFP